MNQAPIKVLLRSSDEHSKQKRGVVTSRQRLPQLKRHSLPSRMGAKTTSAQRHNSLQPSQPLAASPTPGWETYECSQFSRASVSVTLRKKRKGWRKRNFNDGLQRHAGHGQSGMVVGKKKTMCRVWPSNIHSRKIVSQRQYLQARLVGSKSSRRILPQATLTG